MGELNSYPPRNIPSDQDDRDRAITTFDRNVVVTAGAGTGKTTLLVNRLIHLIMRSPDPLKMTEIVALTFTNKAANEMKVRLGDALAAFQHTDPKSEKTKILIDRYDLAVDEIGKRAEGAIRQLERAEIGTMHHFARALLRLFPIEAGVDPQFRIDQDGRALDVLFDEVWEAWLEDELSLKNPRKDLWKTALQKLSLDEIRALAFALSSETVDIKPLQEQTKGNTLPEPIALWLKDLVGRAEDLLSRHPETRNIEKMTATSKNIFQNILETRPGGLGLPEAEVDRIASGKNAAKVKGWDDVDLKVAKELIKTARHLLQVNGNALQNLLALLIPFVRRFRKETVKKGMVSFDALLIRARNLLRDHLWVREALKGRFRAILIDEFQDTDPIQYEILLYLSEVAGEGAKNWQDVHLLPGKLFVVGDPKQSIYGFRRADIMAYHAIRALVLQQGGIECRLTSNFRSHAAILDPINGLFSKLIQAKERFQAEYIPIEPGRPGDAPDPSPFRRLVFRSVEGEADDLHADQARRLEGEALARWLSEEVIGKAIIQDKDGSPRTVQQRDVAILMRALTGVHYYLEPLRRWGIHYVVEGERRFYRSQEVIDAVNLLRSLADPLDRIALVGLLRSAMGGLNDKEIYYLHQQHQLNYRRANIDSSLNPHLKSLYRILNRLHRKVKTLPTGEALTCIFEETPMMLLAAGAMHGEQALANLKKLRHEAEKLGSEASGTFKELVATLAQAVSEGRDETESPLAEEGIDAVKVFSVHKAKGLEFPVVILAGAHVGKGTQKNHPVGIRQDWFSGLIGLHVGDIRDLHSIYLGELEKHREEEEEKRVLYVAMTRAKEHLTISAAKRRGTGSFLSLLEEGLGRQLPEGGSETISIGKGFIEAKNVTIDLTHLHRKQDTKTTAPQVDWDAYAQVLDLRKKHYETLQNHPRFVSPSSMKQDEDEVERADLKALKKEQNTSREMGKLIGRLAHLFLERWDFSAPVDDFRALLSPFVKEQSTQNDFSDDEIYSELEAIFAVFFRSPAYQELSEAKIVGREMPFLMPWEDQVMEGVIDLVYEKEGQLFIADYKTDRIQKEDLTRAAEKYRHQVEIYPKAVGQALQRPVAAMCFIFLRIGETVTITVDGERWKT
ncbi:UvrD-helicase domain-containing protein [Nitrospira defluvii]|nr:UvrD-helicase domain-containing protein [Nitrospira defluvii]